MLNTLIVEDNASFRELLRRILVKQFPSMKVEEAVNGEEALEKVAGLQPDLVFMDIKLSDQSGLELAKQIRSERPKIIIVILTNYDLPEYQEAACQCGADFFFSKDVSADDLVESVRHVLFQKGVNGNEPHGE